MMMMMMMKRKQHQRHVHSAFHGQAAVGPVSVLEGDARIDAADDASWSYLASSFARILTASTVPAAGFGRSDGGHSFGNSSCPPLPILV